MKDNILLYQKRKLQQLLLRFIEKGNKTLQPLLQELIKYIEENYICKNKNEFFDFLYLLSSISDNHFRHPSFLEKIEELILYFSAYIKKYSNIEVFNVFKNNKRILLYLFQKQMIVIDNSLIQLMLQKSYIDQNFDTYFYPEIKFFIDDETSQSISSKISDDYHFEEKRQIGENDSLLCQIIRNDSVDEFDSYLNKYDLKFTEQIEKSIYETHSFLIDKNPTLIEYAAFFGSINIFKYLSDKVQIKSSIWIYAIHSQSKELLNLKKEYITR